MLPAYGYVAGGAGLHEAEGGGQEAHLQHAPERTSKYNASGIFSHMDQISIKTPNPKCRLFLKTLQSRYLAAGVYLSEAPLLLGFVCGGKAILYVRKLRNLFNYTVYNSCICSQNNPIPSPPPLDTVWLHISALIHTRRGGGVSETVRRLDGC